jgi:hypothetical protein
VAGARPLTLLLRPARLGSRAEADIFRFLQAKGLGALGDLSLCLRAAIRWRALGVLHLVEGQARLAKHITAHRA